MTNDLLEQLACLANDMYYAPDSRFDKIEIVNEAKARIEALTADNARLRAIGSEMAESIEGNYYLPGVATRWRAAFTEEETK
jgi:hypothetical protein